LANNNTHTAARATPDAERAVQVAVAELDRHIRDATRDPNYYGKVTVELNVKGGVVTHCRTSHEQTKAFNN